MSKLLQIFVGILSGFLLAVGVQLLLSLIYSMLIFTNFISECAENFFACKSLRGVAITVISVFIAMILGFFAYRVAHLRYPYFSKSVILMVGIVSLFFIFVAVFIRL